MKAHPGPEVPGEGSAALPLLLGSAPASNRREHSSPEAAGRRFRTALPRQALVAVLVCAMLGGVAGLVLALTGARTTTAVTMLTFVPDPALPGVESSASQDITDRFIQTQILLLTGGDVQDAVAGASRSGSQITLSAQQVGATDVVQMEVEAGTADAAVAASAAVIQQYDVRRKAAFASQADALLTGLDGQLAQLEAVLQPGGEDALSASQATEYSRLLALRNQLVLIGAADNSFTRVVDQPRVQQRSEVAAVVKAVAVGLLVGAVVGAALALLLRRVRSV